VKAVFYLFILIGSLTSCASAQTKVQGNNSNYLDMSWKEVATKMPAEWYGSDEAKLVAENVLLCQKDIGGWAKNKPYHHVFTESEKAQFIEEKGEVGATFDNGATINELAFLAKVYTTFKDDRYKQAFNNGLDYIFVAQYENGGWPQFYPFRTGKSVAYASQITYNDNAMVNIMLFLKDVYSDEPDFVAFQITSDTKAKAQSAFDKGVGCILKSQIIVNGKPTVWCAQHDAVTLAPTNARKYELASYSGSESVGITQLLMNIKNPSAEIIAAVEGALAWFESHKIEGIRLDSETDAEGKKNVVVVEDKSAPALWARFYDLETEKPYFCDRDGIKKATLAEIGSERRNGYDWYTDAPSKLFKKYPDWKKKLEAK
jgi:PelA/Pel-15E family pectate lyase